MPPPRKQTIPSGSVNEARVSPSHVSADGARPQPVDPANDPTGGPILDKPALDKPEPALNQSAEPEPPVAEFQRLEEVQAPVLPLLVERYDDHRKAPALQEAEREGRPNAPDFDRGALSVKTQQAQRFRYRGKYPCIAVNNNNQAVVVYHHNNFINDMYYCVGRLNPANGDIEWGEEHWYDMGAYPRVAVNNSGVVVEVHESPRKRKTWYHVGVIYEDKIDWGHSYEIGQGLHPAVALSADDEVVVVEESGGRFSPEAYYFFGKVNKVDKTIQFSRKRELLVHSAREPSVTMMGKNIIVAFRHERNRGKLYSMLGRIDGLNVQWAEYEFHPFAEGNWPGISLNVNGIIVATCQTYTNRHVLCREGLLKEKDGSYYVEWSRREARRYDEGVYPTVCLLEDNRLIEFHGTHKFNGHTLWYALGYVSN